MFAKTLVAKYNCYFRSQLQRFNCTDSRWGGTITAVISAFCRVGHKGLLETAKPSQTSLNTQAEKQVFHQNGKPDLNISQNRETENPIAPWASMARSELPTSLGIERFLFSWFLARLLEGQTCPRVHGWFEQLFGDFLTSKIPARSISWWKLIGAWNNC